MAMSDPGELPTAGFKAGQTGLGSNLSGGGGNLLATYAGQEDDFNPSAAVCRTPVRQNRDSKTKEEGGSDSYKGEPVAEHWRNKLGASVCGFSYQ